MRKAYPFLLLTLTAWLSTAFAAQTAGEKVSLLPPPQRHVVTLTPKPGFHNEPGVAIDPSDPRRAVAVWQIGASAAYTTDGGTHWTKATGTAPKNFKMSGDPSVAFDNRGHVYLCYIAFDKLGTSQYWGHNATRNGVFVRRSFDGGRTWEQKPVPVLQHPTEPGIPFEDKPIIVVDNSNSPYAGTLYVGWTQFTLTESLLVLSRSTDGGKTWSEPQRISTQAGLPRDDNGAVEGFTGAVARNGTLYVAWADGDGIAFTSSRDGGRTFQPSRTVLPTAPLFYGVEAVDRANGFPVLTIDDRPDAPERIYLTWSDYRNGDVDVFTAASTDHGQTWSAPVRVNNDSVHDGKDQFFAWAAVDHSDGALNVIFYDRRDSKQNRALMVTLARSLDGANTFHNYSWTSAGFEPAGEFIGDYLGVAAQGGRVYGVWTKRVRPPAKAKKTGKKSDGHGKAQSTIVQAGVAEFK